MGTDDPLMLFGSGNDNINYSIGGWHPYTLGPLSGITYGARCAQTPDVSFSFTYQFVAISIWGFYIPNSTLPVLSASLDGEHVQASPPPRSSDNPNIWHRWEVITADNLSQANHTIELVVQDAGPHYWFCLHEIVLTPTSHISQYLVSSSGNATTDTTPTSNKESSKPKSSVGAIVGGVIGAIAFVLLVGAVGVYLWRRRRGRYTYARTQVYDDDRHSISSRQRTFSLPSFRLPRFGPKRKAPAAMLEARPPPSIHSSRAFSPPPLESPWLDDDLNEKPSIHSHEDSTYLGQRDVVDLIDSDAERQPPRHTTPQPARVESPQPIPSEAPSRLPSTV